jgi:hypothetical protein
MKFSVVIASLFLAGSANAFQSAFIRGSSPLSTVRSESALCMKTIAVFGAAGLTASECVYQALQEGDNVIGLTR